MTARNRMTSLITMACSIIVLSGMVSSLAEAGAREQAKQIHDRIAGVPPSEIVPCQHACAWHHPMHTGSMIRCVTMHAVSGYVSSHSIALLVTSARATFYMLCVA